MSMAWLTLPVLAIITLIMCGHKLPYRGQFVAGPLVVFPTLVLIGYADGALGGAAMMALLAGIGLGYFYFCLISGDLDMVALGMAATGSLVMVTAVAILMAVTEDSRVPQTSSPFPDLCIHLFTR